MLEIAFPSYSFKTRQTGLLNEIFDPFRKKWVKLTPEEWVRQNFVQYMVQDLKYPASLIAIERELKLMDMKKRFDIVVYDREGKAWMLIECKSMDIPLSANVLSQVLAYKSQLPCRYMLITNGTYTEGWEINATDLESLKKMPQYGR